jgi:hypothetical protein
MCGLLKKWINHNRKSHKFAQKSNRVRQVSDEFSVLMSVLFPKLTQPYRFAGYFSMTKKLIYFIKPDSFTDIVIPIHCFSKPFVPMKKPPENGFRSGLHHQLN